MYVRCLYISFILCLAAASAAAQIIVPGRSKPPIVIPSDTVDAKVSLLEGNAVFVHDGDAITVVCKDGKIYKIRLQGSDAPESKQDHGEKAKQNLAALIQGMDITVIVSGEEVDDEYFGRIYLDGQDVGLMQIELGMAWYFSQNIPALPEEIGNKYAQAEARSRSARRGLWADKNPMPPWEFRPGKKVPQPVKSDSAASPDAPVKIIGNMNSGIYHWPGCSGYAKVAPHNRILFNTVKEAEAAGYRAAKNCSVPRP